MQDPHRVGSVSILSRAGEGLMGSSVPEDLHTIKDGREWGEAFSSVV